jgi:hypothetical protein
LALDRRLTLPSNSPICIGASSSHRGREDSSPLSLWGRVRVRESPPP